MYVLLPMVIVNVFIQGVPAFLPSKPTLLAQAAGEDWGIAKPEETMEGGFEIKGGFGDCALVPGLRKIKGQHLGGQT